MVHYKREQKLEHFRMEYGRSVAVEVAKLYQLSDQESSLSVSAFVRDIMTCAKILSENGIKTKIVTEIVVFAVKGKRSAIESAPKLDDEIWADYRSEAHDANPRLTTYRYARLPGKTDRWGFEDSELGMKKLKERLDSIERRYNNSLVIENLDG